MTLQIRRVVTGHGAEGRAKVEIALARGKKLHDKRETLKKRSWERERGRLMRMKG